MYDYNKRELTEEEKSRRLDKMIENWKKSSKDNFINSEKEHTKADEKKKKKENAKRRKINEKKRGSN